MEGSGSATLIFKIPKYNENSSSKEPKIWQSFALLFCVNMKMSRTWGGRLLIATSSDWMDKRRPLCFLFDSLWVQTTLLQMLVSDPRHQPGILWCHRLNSSWPGIILEFQNCLESSSLDLGTTPPPLPKAAFLARKSYISYIPGFTAGDGDHSLTFLTVYIGAPAVERYFITV